MEENINMFRYHLISFVLLLCILVCRPVYGETIDYTDKNGNSFQVGKYILQEGNWRMIYYKSGYEITKLNGESFRMDCDFISESILSTEDGFYYGKNQDIVFFDFSSCTEKILSSGWNAAEPLAILGDKFYCIAEHSQYSLVFQLVEINLADGSIASYELPEMGNEYVVCSGDLYYLCPRYQLVSDVIYKMDLETKELTQIEDAAGSSIIGHKDRLYYCRTEESMKLLEDDVQVVVVALDTISGEKTILFTGTYGEVGEPAGAAEDVMFWKTSFYEQPNKFYYTKLDQWEPKTLFEGESLNYMGYMGGTVYAGSDRFSSTFYLSAANLHDEWIRRTDRQEGNLLGWDKGFHYYQLIDDNGICSYYYAGTELKK